MLYIDIKYSQFAGAYLDRFKIAKNFPFLARARCKICGDSQKSKSKTRFYFYEKGGKINAQCHNCGYSSSLGFYLKEYEPNLYSQYVFEKFKDTDKPCASVIEFTPKPISYQKKVIEYTEHELVKVSELPDSDPVKQYVESRKIPKSYPLLLARNFCKFASKYKDDFKNAQKDHARIVIPFYDSDKEFCGFQARSLNGEQPKYITIFANDDATKIFGLDRLKVKRPVYIVEGPIDSLFVPNCIAALSSALSECAIKAQKIINNNLNDFILVYDNEPRNKEIVKLYDKSIESGYNVVVWPQSYNYKDINEAVIDGVPPQEVFDIIKNNVYTGIEARIRFNAWKKFNERSINGTYF